MVQKLLVQLVVFIRVESQFFKAATGEPVRRTGHLKRAGTCPLQINDPRDTPVVVDKDVTLVKVGQGESKRPCAKSSIHEFREKRSHGRQRRQLRLPILFVVDGVWLMSKTVVMAS